MEGPIEFIEGIATGTKDFLGSVVGGAGGALSKVTGNTRDRVQWKEHIEGLLLLLTSNLEHSLRNPLLRQVFVLGIKGAKERGTPGLVDRPIVLLT